MTKRATTVVTPEEIHLGLYKRDSTETRGEAQMVPRKLEISEQAVAKEARELVAMAEFVFGQNEAQGMADTIELQCTTKEVEKEVRKQLGKKARHIRFLPPKVESIRGQYEYGQ